MYNFIDELHIGHEPETSLLNIINKVVDFDQVDFFSDYAKGLRPTVNFGAPYTTGTKINYTSSWHAIDRIITYNSSSDMNESITSCVEFSNFRKPLLQVGLYIRRPSE